MSTRTDTKHSLVNLQTEFLSGNGLIDYEQLQSIPNNMVNNLDLEETLRIIEENFN